MRHIRGIFALGAMALMAASSAAAQFTTVVAPPKREAAANADVRVADAAARDTGRRATLTEMSAWVDSVAGTAPTVAATTPVVVDSANGEVAASPKPGSGTERFADGARAPDTASPLPALLLAGVLAMMTGAAMLATRRRAA